MTDFYNLPNAKTNYKIIVDTDIQVIVKNIKNGDMLRFHRAQLNIESAVKNNPELPILKNDNGVFILRMEIKPSEIMIEAKPNPGKKNLYVISASHGLMRKPLFYKDVKAASILDALDIARTERDSMKGPFLADTYGKSTNNVETSKGRSELKKKWAK